MDLPSELQHIVNEWQAAKSDGKITLREVVSLVWTVIYRTSLAVASLDITGLAKRAIVANAAEQIINFIWPQFAATSLLIKVASWMPKINLKVVAIAIADSLIDLIYRDAVIPKIESQDTQIAPENSQ